MTMERCWLELAGEFGRCVARVCGKHRSSHSGVLAANKLKYLNFLKST